MQGPPSFANTEVAFGKISGKMESRKRIVMFSQVTDEYKQQKTGDSSGAAKSSWSSLGLEGWENVRKQRLVATGSFEIPELGALSTKSCNEFQTEQFGLDIEKQWLLRTWVQAKYLALT